MIVGLKWLIEPPSRWEGEKLSRGHAVDAAVNQAHHGHVGEIVDDVEAAVVLVQAEQVVQGQAQGLAQDDKMASRRGLKLV